MSDRLGGPQAGTSDGGKEGGTRSPARGPRHTHLPSWQSYSTMESSSLLEMTVSPLGLKSKQLILSEFSRNTLATRKLLSTLSVSFMAAAVAAAAAGGSRGGAGPGRGREARERAGCSGPTPAVRAPRWQLAGGRLTVRPPRRPPQVTLSRRDDGTSLTVLLRGHLRANRRCAGSLCSPS